MGAPLNNPVNVLKTLPLKSRGEGDDAVDMDPPLPVLSALHPRPRLSRIVFLVVALAASAAAGWATAGRVTLPTLESDEITHVHVLLKDGPERRTWFRVYAPWIHERLKAITWDYARHALAAMGDARQPRTAQDHAQWPGAASENAAARSDATAAPPVDHERVQKIQSGGEKSPALATFYLRWASGREYECLLLPNHVLQMAHVEIPLSDDGFTFLMGLLAQARAGIDYVPPPRSAG